jgi:hypothetical protein
VYHLTVIFYVADQPTIKAVGPWQERLDSSGRHEVQIWSKFVWRVLTNEHVLSTTKCCSDRYAYALRQRQRASVEFRWSPSCEIVWANRHDSLKCRSGTQERELGVQLVTSSASFLMWYYFALFSTKTFECTGSPPTFRQHSDSRWPVFSPIICILCKERSYMRPCTWFSTEIVWRILVNCLTKSVYWNAHRVSLSSVPHNFLLGYDALIWYAPLVCVFTVPKLISTRFSQRSVKPVLRRPVNSATLVGAWPRQQCQYDKHADGKWQRMVK